jgi:hypothetical protein
MLCVYNGLVSVQHGVGAADARVTQPPNRLTWSFPIRALMVSASSACSAEAYPVTSTRDTVPGTDRGWPPPWLSPPDAGPRICVSKQPDGRGGVRVHAHGRVYCIWPWVATALAVPPPPAVRTKDPHSKASGGGSGASGCIKVHQGASGPQQGASWRIRMHQDTIRAALGCIRVHQGAPGLNQGRNRVPFGFPATGCRAPPRPAPSHNRVPTPPRKGCPSCNTMSCCTASK